MNFNILLLITILYGSKNIDFLPFLESLNTKKLIDKKSIVPITTYSMPHVYHLIINQSNQ